MNPEFISATGQNPYRVQAAYLQLHMITWNDLVTHIAFYDSSDTTHLRQVFAIRG